MRLYIAEKPEIGRAIAEALEGRVARGEGYIKVGDNIISWCFGHLLQLKNPDEYDEKYKKWRLEDLPFNIKKLELKPIQDKNKQINIIKRLLSEAREVINAGDPDEEGQLLVDEVLEYIGNKKPVKRVLINDNTKEAVKKALNNLKDNKEFEGFRNSAYVRSVADWKYGLNLTRAYTIKANKGTTLSVGRVQTPILNLIYEREEEVRKHIKEKYYNLYSNNEFKYVIAKEKLEDKLCKNKEYLEDVQKEASSSNDFIIKKIEKKRQENHPPLPYNLLELQADSFKKYKYKPEVVKSITQSLREKHKAITYNRSDCQYLSDEHYEQREDLIRAIKDNLEEYKDLGLETKLRHRAFNNDNISAHHAIIPTINRVNINNLSRDELNIYRLIAERYLVLYLKAEIVEKTTYNAINSTHLEFTVTTSKVLDRGYKEFYNSKGNNRDKSKDKNNENTENEDIEEEKEEENNRVYSYEKGESANFKEFIIKESETKPKQEYTFATLLKDLTSVAKYIKDERLRKELIEKDKDKKGESGGIGTPATRDSIIKLLFDRGFIEENKSRIITTALGKEFLNSLPEIAKTPDMTALWAEKQREIKQGKLSVEQFLESIDSFLAQEIAKIKTTRVKINTQVVKNKFHTENEKIIQESIEKRANKKVSKVNEKNNQGNIKKYDNVEKIANKEFVYRPKKVTTKAAIKANVTKTIESKDSGNLTKIKKSLLKKEINTQNQQTLFSQLDTVGIKENQAKKRNLPLDRKLVKPKEIKLLAEQVTIMQNKHDENNKKTSNGIKKEIIQGNNLQFKVEQNKSLQYKCPKCQEGYLRQKNGMYGIFWGCNQYPTCRGTYKDNNGTPQGIKIVK